MNSQFASLVNEELADIINKLKEEISDDSDMVWTNYDTAGQLKNELETYLGEIQIGERRSIEKIRHLFMPTMTLQEHSISNGWSEKYLALAKQFDNIYRLTNRI